MNKKLPASCYRELGPSATLFYMTVFEKFWKKLVSFEAEVGHHTCLNNELKDLREYAFDKKADSAIEFLSDFPLNGFEFSSNRSEKGRETLKIDSRDMAYRFTGVAEHPVYIAVVNIVNVDYDSVTPVPYTFLCSYSREEASLFLEDYYATMREKYRRAVMSYRGHRIPNFRKMKWDEIYLPGQMCNDIRNDVEGFFKSEEMYAKHGLDWRMGLLFAGPPGNGKTAICRAVATTSEVPVVYCALDDDMYSVMAHLQATTATQAPCVVIIEDADTLGAEPALRSNFLNLLDGLFTTEGVLTIASTNCPEKLDPAFTGRPSRFDCLFAFSNPKPKQRKSIFLNRLGKIAESFETAEIDQLIEKMDDLSGAAVQEVAVKALRTAFREKKEVTLDLLRDGLDQVKKHMTASAEGLEKLTSGSLGFSPGGNSPRSDPDEEY